MHCRPWSRQIKHIHVNIYFLYVISLIRVIHLQANYINEMGLAGTMVWALEVDDFHGFCGPQKGLLVAINNVLGRKI